MRNQVIARTLRGLGVADAEAGLPIDTFYKHPMKRHSESARAEYEIGYRSVRQDSCNRKHENWRCVREAAHKGDCSPFVVD